MTRYAAIDVGTNTVRLLVTDDSVPVERGLEITRLGQGVDGSRRLHPDAVARTVDAVRGFADRAKGIGAERVRLAGTSAVRGAADRADLIEAVRTASGLEMEVLDGAEEGRLAFLGATRGLAPGPFCVVDIGGGSTEFIRGATEAEAVISVDIGSVRLRERCLSSDPPTRGEMGGARSVVDAALTEAERHLGLVGDETLVGVAGTVTTLAALELGLEVYDPERVHGSRLAASAVASWTERLLSMPVSEVRDLPTMHPGRADVIAAGALILDRVCARWGYPEVLVSEADILAGLIADMAGPGHPDAPDVFGV